MKRAKKFLKRILKIVRLEEMQILPGELAFFIVLTIFSILPLIGYVGSSFITDGLINSFKENLPTAVSTIFTSLMDIGDSGLFDLIFFVACAIYIASGGCNAMILTSNVIYKIKNKNVVRQKIKSLFMMFILVFLMLFIVLVPAFGELIIKSIQSHYPGPVIDGVYTVFSWLRYPLSFVLIFGGVKTLYTVAPDEKIPSKHTNFGAFVTTLSWIVITRVYSIYLNSINTYNLFYGSLANVVIMLFWLYLLTYVFTFGMALNADHYFESQKLSNKEENS